MTVLSLVLCEILNQNRRILLERLLGCLPPGLRAKQQACGTGQTEISVFSALWCSSFGQSRARLHTILLSIYFPQPHV